MAEVQRTTDTFHPLCFNGFRHWRDVAGRYGVDRGYRDRAAAISAVSFLTGPLRVLESAVYGRRVARTRIERAPVFILGHWRSGTTLLHDLMARDPQFGYVSLFQTLAPSSFLMGERWLKPLLARGVPQTRPMDNVRIGMDYPQEEEFALAHVCRQSFYLGFYFPRFMPELFERYGLMQGITSEELASWRDHYVSILKKATLRGGGRRLVVKNPVHTARVRALLNVFPEAKFVHIVRNPYDVYRSTIHLHHSVLALTALQGLDGEQIRENVLRFYRQMMEAYLDQRGSIPAGNLVEVRYEDLEEAPLETVGGIYDGLRLRGWEAAQPGMARYLESRSAFKKNVYAFEHADLAAVEEHWGFALEAWNYDRPGVPDAEPQAVGK